MESPFFEHNISCTNIGFQKQIKLSTYIRRLFCADRSVIFCISQRAAGRDLGRRKQVDSDTDCNTGDRQYRDLFVDQPALVDHRTHDE